MALGKEHGFRKLRKVSSLGLPLGPVGLDPHVLFENSVCLPRISHLGRLRAKKISYSAKMAL